MNESAGSGIPRPNFGGFNAARTYAAGTMAEGDSPMYVSTTADFNRDGRPDVVTVQGNGWLNVILNNGDGSFGKPWSAKVFDPFVSKISQLLAADLNGDGYTDVAAIDIGGDLIHILLNQRNATFGPDIIISAGSGGGGVTPQKGGDAPALLLGSAALADINGDGSQDIVTISRAYDTHDTTVVGVQTFLGNGDGTFWTDSTYLLTSIESIPVGDVPDGRAAALADMNGDGKLDFVAEIHGLNPPTSNKQLLMEVVTFPGNGDGTFQAGLWSGAAVINADLPFSIDMQATSVLSLADLNHDSILDMVLSFDHSEYTIFSALGNGDGTFSAPIVAATGAYADDLAVADFDGDGAPELIQKDSGDVWFYRSNGDGTFALTARYPASRTELYGYFNIADFDGDGLLDFATTDSLEQKLSVYLNAGSGFKASETLFRDGDSTEQFWPDAVLDVNGDGLQDIFFYHRLRGVYSLVSGMSDGVGGFRYIDALPPDITFPYEWADPKPADFNNDGKPDLVFHYTEGTFAIALSNGDGTFQTPIAGPHSSTTDACSLGEWASGDVNGDGNVDLVVAHAGDDLCSGNTYGPGFFVLPGNGDGTFGTPVHHDLGSAPYKPILADFNGDYILDLVIADVPVQRTGAPFNTFLLPGNGDGTFAAPTALVANNIVVDVLHGDINGDGKRDLILLSTGFVDSASWVSYSSLAGVIELLGNGDGTFGSPTISAVGFPAMTGALADVNGDGVLDLISSQYLLPDVNQAQAGLSVAIGFGDGSFAKPINYAAGSSPWKLLPGDFWADGSTDLVVSTEDGGTLILNQGGTTNALTSSANPAGIGQEITFTASIAAVMNGRPQPSGAVDFFDGNQWLGTAALNEGTATFVTSSLASGVHNVLARYSGDDSFNVSTSNSVSVAVNSLPPDLTLAANNSSISVTRGKTGLITLSVATNGTFDGSVQFQCSGLPSGAECVFSPSTLEVGGDQTATVTVAINTSGNTVALNSNHQVLAALGTTGATRRFPWQAAIGLPGLLLLWPYRRKLRRSAISLCALVLILVSVAGMTSCGDSESSTPSPETSIVTITANATSGATTVTRTTTISLTLQ